jgi:purine nucleosidase
MNDEAGLTLPGFVHKIVKFYYKFYMDRIGFKGCPLHDPLAMGVLINPSFVQTKSLSLRVITTSEQKRGHIEVDNTKAKPTTNVCLKVDSKKFLKFVIDTINLPES